MSQDRPQAIQNDFIADQPLSLAEQRLWASLTELDR